MSRFSKRCKELLAENETTAYRISKNTGLEITGIQRMITGKRLPNISFVKDFCHALRIPPLEEQRLLNLYHIEQLGENKYKNYQSILSLLSSLNAYSKNVPEKYVDTNSSVFAENPMTFTTIENHFFKSELLIQSVLLHTFLSKEDNFIHTNIPTDTSILHQILLLNNQYPEHTPQICHLLTFQMSESNAHQNIKALQHILPLSLSKSLSYTVYYYYSKMTANDYPLQVFPFYIITKDCVLELSHDMQSAMLHSDNKIIKHYENEFQKVCALSSLLLEKHTQPQNASQVIFTHYSNFENSCKYELQFQPCFARMIPKELCERKIQELPPMLQTLGQQILPFTYKTVDTIQICIFSKSGLEYFYRTGDFRGQISSLFPTFLPEERKEILENFYRSIENDPEHIYLMCKNEISPPADICMEFTDQQTLQITQLKGINDIAICILKETNIINSFFDFIQYLKTSDLIYSKEETSQFLLTLIDEL